MKALTIRWRLALWYAAAMVVVLSLFCLLLLVLARQQSLSRLDAALREELRELVLEMRMARTTEEFENHVQTRFFQHDAYDFQITSEQGSILFASSRISTTLSRALATAKAGSSTEFFDIEIGGVPSIRAAGTRVEVPMGVYSAHALTSLAPLDADTKTLQLLMIGMLPLSLALALAGGYFLAARALAPVEQIVRVAETITISNLGQRIEIANSSDELGRLAATLNSLIARLQSAVEEIQRFTADASHELRTPLAVLRSEAEFALRMRRSPQEYQQTLTTVVEEATRLGHLADQLLNLSRHDAGLTDGHRERIRMDLMLKSVVEQARPLSIEREISLDTTAISPCEVIGDPLALSQAVFNVIDNAIKYTPPGGTVSVECETHDSFVGLRISDTGIGIAGEHLSRVFERFYRVDPSRQSSTGGIGLGLAITQAAIRRDGGDIQIESEKGVGTTLTIRLPGSKLDLENPGSSSLSIRCNVHDRTGGSQSPDGESINAENESGEANSLPGRNRNGCTGGEWLPAGQVVEHEVGNESREDVASGR